MDVTIGLGDVYKPTRRPSKSSILNHHNQNCFTILLLNYQTLLLEQKNKPPSISTSSSNMRFSTFAAAPSATASFASLVVADNRHGPYEWCGSSLIAYGQ